MNEIAAKILKLLFSKTTLAYIVVGLVIVYTNFWFKKSQYSPKSIKESIVNVDRKIDINKQASIAGDSVLRCILNEQSTDLFIMRMQIDTMINYQTPVVINNLKLIREISNQMIHQNIRGTSYILQPIPPIIKTEPIDTRYEKAMILIDEIGLSMKPDTSKKKLLKNLFNIFKHDNARTTKRGRE